MGWTRLALRRLRDDRAATLGLAVLVLVTAFLAALAPRVIAGLADGAVQSEVASAAVQARNIALLQDLGIAAGPAADPLALVREAGLEHEATFPVAVRALIELSRAKGQCSKASQLAETYLQRHPKGAFADEAARVRSHCGE